MLLPILSSATCAPCRQIMRKGHRNFAHYFPSIKNGKSIGCESHLEAECCFLLEFDREIARYHAQPHCVEWSEGGNDFRYTPDFLVHCTDGSFYLIEVKYDFTHLQQRYREKLDAFARLCRAQGWSYQQWTMSNIRGHTNLDTLKYLYSRSHHIATSDEFFFREATREIQWPQTLGQLIKQLPQFSVNLICHLLFSQTLRADLTQAVTLDLVIHGYHDHEQSAA